MSAQVAAAIIAASVSALTLIGTLAAQYFGRRATSRDTEKTLDRTLKEQRAQLDTTLAEQSRQLDRTLAEQRTRTLNERFATAAEQLGGDKPPAVQLAGVYAMAVLADDWGENRQTCVDVLCAYLRMPYEPDPGADAPAKEQRDFRASREVRHTVIRVIAAHLKDGAPVSWQGLNLDFTGVVFDAGDFTGAVFSGDKVSFRDAVFSSGKVSFRDAVFSGSAVLFSDARFSGGTVDFSDAKFPLGVSFGRAEFSGGTVDFNHVEFSCGTIFTGGMVEFIRAKFSGGTVRFTSARFPGGHVSFSDAEFSGSTVDFYSATFSGGTVDFARAVFSDGTVSFHRANWYKDGVYFSDAKFFGATIDFSKPWDWTCPPKIPWPDGPPQGVKLPTKESQA